MDYKTKVKVESDNLSLDLAKGEFNVNGIIDSNIANVGKIYNEDGITGGVNPASILTDMTPYGGMVIDFLPSVGGRIGAQRTQLAFKDQFVKVVGSAYSSLTLNECDLIKLAYYSEGLYLLIAEVDRALHTYDKFDKVNKAFGRFLVELQGFSWSELATRRQEWIDKRNVLAHMVNEKFYLGKSARLERHIKLASKIFATDINRKTQLVVFRPMEYVRIDDLTTWEIALGSFTIPGTQTVSKNISLVVLNNLINAVRDASMSAWYDDVAPYLHHLYGDGDKDLYKIADYVDYDDFAAVYDANIITLIKNIRLLGYSALSGGGLADTNIYIWENASGYIRQGGRDSAGLGTNAAEFLCTDYDAYSGTDSAGLDIIFPTSFNVESYPHADEEVKSAMLGRYSVNVYDGAREVVVWTSSTLFYSANIGYSASGAEGAVTGYLSITNNVTDSNVGNFNTGSKLINLNSFSRWQVLSRYGKYFMFGVMPYVALISGTIASPAIEILHYDIDNEFQVSYETWQQFATAEVYESNKFAVPNFVPRK